MQPSGHQISDTPPTRTPRVLQREPVVDIASRRQVRGASGSSMRCVSSSGYLTGACSCEVTIPAGIVAAAWGRRRRAGVSGDSFFHFSHEGDVWLAYGRRDGSIRGVYCPEHLAERDLRCSGGDPVAQVHAPAAQPRVLVAGA